MISASKKSWVVTTSNGVFVVDRLAAHSGMAHLETEETWLPYSQEAVSERARKQVEFSAKKSRALHT